MALHNELGQKGENVAFTYLTSKGYEVLFKNWSKGRHEIDIIAKRNEKIIIVEVKTRTGKVFETSNVIPRKKVKSLISACNCYLERLENETECQIDLLIIEKKSGYFNVIHIEDAIGQE